MFGGLFDDDDASTVADLQQSGSKRSSIPRPSSPRSGTNLSGLSNLGATCYMNALLQTMTYTPELREALFTLTQEELGICDNGGAKDNLVRAIPNELRVLFSRILLLNQSSVGVEGLINSFGWTNNEELQQHDVQELNRILFDALESSLVGTSGQRVVRHLFHGTSVQQIICGGCGRISEREEDFLDLPVPLSNKGGLDHTLRDSYCESEALEGKNQYHCDQCRGLVDAKRCCRLRTLPPILTFALLRFLYDYNKGERYKDISKFPFPLTLDMSPYVDTPVAAECPRDSSEDHTYDLFSVVIHGGSTHSGHYTAYIRDFDGLGTWTHPNDEAVSLSFDSHSTDPLEFNSPMELLSAILRQTGGTSSLNTLCKHLQDQTGVTWNKRFKQLYGPIRKFLEKNSDVFTFDNASLIVSLKESCPGGVPPATPTDHSNETTGDKESSNNEPSKPSKRAPPPLGQCWYEFNDSRVSSIATETISTMFQGKQSAYMLFYRQRSLQRPSEAMGNPSFGVPERLKLEVAIANEALEAERKCYDIAINTVTLTLHCATVYTQMGGALQTSIGTDLVPKIDIDRRLTMAELKERVFEGVKIAGIIDEDLTVIHTARHLPAGLHVYDCISTIEGERIIQEAGLTSDTDLFIWNGHQVGGMPLLIGSDNEPIHLNLSYPGMEGMIEVSSCFPKSSSLFVIRDYFSQFLTCSPVDVAINQVKRSARSGNASVTVLSPSKDGHSLIELKLDNGDHLTAELKSERKKGVQSFARSVAEIQNKLMTFIVENRCTGTGADGNYPAHPVEVSKTEKLSQVKLHILSQLHLIDLEAAGCGGSRLRIDDDLQGLGPPLCEEQSLVDAGITQGCRVVLEKGVAPATNEICINCQSEIGQSDSLEVFVQRSATVDQCCKILVSTFGLEGDEWHLRRTNWCGELGEILDDGEATLDKLRIKSGNSLFLESGRLPPKGYVRISVYRHEPESNSKGVETLDCHVDCEGVVKMEDTPSKESVVPLHEQDPAQYYPPVVGVVTRIGTVEIKRDSKLEHIKEAVVTLPALCGVVAPTLGFLRIRDIVGGRPGKVYRNHSTTLKQMKLYSGGDICVQVLSFEEELSATEIVFYLQVRNSFTRSYSPPIEATYDTARSAAPTGLRNFVGDLLEIPPDRLSLAKHKFQSFQWIKIEDSKGGGNSGPGRKGKGKGSKGADKSSCSNIKNSPVLLRDGDTIGVKDLQQDAEDKDDFTTSLDNKGAAILLAIQEEKRKSRKAKAANGDGSVTGSKRQRRPEVGIKIFVPDFSSKS